jgi:hypothetical protein
MKSIFSASSSGVSASNICTSGIIRGNSFMNASSSDKGRFRFQF